MNSNRIKNNRYQQTLLVEEERFLCWANMYFILGKPMGAVSAFTTGNYHCQPWSSCDVAFVMFSAQLAFKCVRFPFIFLIENIWRQLICLFNQSRHLFTFPIYLCLEMWRQLIFYFSQSQHLFTFDFIWRHLVYLFLRTFTRWNHDQNGTVFAQFEGRFCTTLLRFHSFVFVSFLLSSLQNFACFLLFCNGFFFQILFVE